MRDIDIRSLKELAQKNQHSLFYEIISKEPDFISEVEYIAKVPIWLELLKKGE